MATKITGNLKFRDRDPVKRDAAIARRRAKLEAEHGPGDWGVTVHDSMESATFVFVPDAGGDDA